MATIAILLIVVLVLTFGKQLNLFGGQPNQSATTSDQNTAVNSSVNEAVESAISNKSMPATQRYLDAIKIYKTSNYYFQFVECHGRPGSQTLKAGVKFMLDNRDAKTHKIAVVGGQSFTIGAYNFAIATAPSKIGTHYITCDGGGAAKIEVQK